MSIRRLQGWALIISAIISLLSLVGPVAPGFRLLFIVGGILLMLGVPAIESVQRSGTLGWVGIALVEIGALIALILNLMSLGGSADFGAALPLTSAAAGGIGAVIVGWLTARGKAFAPWIGWAFLVEGVLNFLSGVIEVPSLGPVVGILLPLLGAAALLGYGWSIVRHEA